MRGFLERLEFAEGAVELAFVRGFVAEDVGDGVALVASEGAEGVTDHFICPGERRIWS